MVPSQSFCPPQRSKEPIEQGQKHIEILWGTLVMSVVMFDTYTERHPTVGVYSMMNLFH